MESFSENNVTGSCEAKSEQLLALAKTAHEGNDQALAAHLYCAAFEAAKKEGTSPSRQAIAGLETAWKIAQDLEDHSLSEAILKELTPYQTLASSAVAVPQIPSVASPQIPSVAPADEPANSAPATPEAQVIPFDASELTDNLKSIFSHMNAHPSTPSKPKASNDKPANHSSGSQELDAAGIPPFAQFLDSLKEGAGIALSLPFGNPEEAQSKTRGAIPFNYSDIHGYQNALHTMRTYGFEAAGDDHFRSFVQAASRQHGVEHLSLFEPFVFYGPSRDDLREFAEATAGEIGWPTITLQVEYDNQGMGSIKLGGPFRRGLFGSTDFSEVPSPCILLIENADLLMPLLNRIERNQVREEMYEFGAPRDPRSEVLGLINMILAKSDVFIIATATQVEALDRSMMDMLGPAQCICVDLPTAQERAEIWHHLVHEHPSAGELSADRVIELSQGVSRRDMMTAGRAAVEAAYRGSLRAGTYQKVSLGDFLAELAPFVRDNSEVYERLEDAAASEFRRELNEQ